MKICYVGTSLQVFCSTAFVIALSLPWLTNAQAMSLALYPHFGLHLLFSDPPKSGDNGCYTGKEETGTTERESGANRRRLRSEVLNYADFMSMLQTHLPESLSSR